MPSSSPLENRGWPAAARAKPTGAGRLVLEARLGERAQRAGFGTGVLFAVIAG